MPTMMKTMIVITLMSDNQNSVSPKAFTENILIKKIKVKNIKLHARGLSTLNISQNWRTFDATIMSHLLQVTTFPI